MNRIKGKNFYHREYKNVQDKGVTSRSGDLGKSQLNYCCGIFPGLQTYLDVLSKRVGVDGSLKGLVGLLRGVLHEKKRERNPKLLHCRTVAVGRAIS